MFIPKSSAYLSNWRAIDFENLHSNRQTKGVTGNTLCILLVIPRLKTDTKKGSILLHLTEAEHCYFTSSVLILLKYHQ